MQATLRRPPVRPLAVAAALLAACGSDARTVSRATALSAGLDRVWVSQAALDPTTQTLAGATLDGGSLYLVTSSGAVQALDAETGAPRWSTRVEADSTVVAGPAVRRYTEADETGAERVVTRCAVVAGARVYVLVETPRGVATESVQTTEGAPAGAPTLGKMHVFVPSISGRIVGYPLDSAGVKVRLAGSAGATGEAAATDTHVLWTSIRGEMNVAPLGTGSAPYRFAMGSPLAGPVEVAGELAYLASQDGVVQAVETAKGRTVWRVSLGEELRGPVAVIGGVAYVATAAPTLHAFDAATGERKWSVEGLGAIASATDKRAFAVAPDGALGVLEIESGRPVAALPGGGALTPVVNRQTDRLYFVSRTGLLQCLREAERHAPYRHGQAASDEQPKPDADPAADEPTDSFDTPAEDSGEPADDPAEEPATDEPNEDGPTGDEPAGEGPAADPFDPFAPAEGEAAPEGEAPAADEDDPFADF